MAILIYIHHYGEILLKVTSNIYIYSQRVLWSKSTQINLLWKRFGNAKTQTRLMSIFLRNLYVLEHSAFSKSNACTNGYVLSANLSRMCPTLKFRHDTYTSWGMDGSSKELTFWWQLSWDDFDLEINHCIKFPNKHINKLYINRLELAAIAVKCLSSSSRSHRQQTYGFWMATNAAL